MNYKDMWKKVLTDVLKQPSETVLKWIEESQKVYAFPIEKYQWFCERRFPDDFMGFTQVVLESYRAGYFTPYSSGWVKYFSFNEKTLKFKTASNVLGIVNDLDAFVEYICLNHLADLGYSEEEAEEMRGYYGSIQK